MIKSTYYNIIIRSEGAKTALEKPPKSESKRKPIDDDPGPTESQSSTSCEPSTTKNVSVNCYATTAPGRKAHEEKLCTSSTEKITGCDFIASTTTATSSCTNFQTTSNCHVTCSKIKTTSPATASVPCSTSCSTISGCQATGTTTTVTQTASKEADKTGCEVSPCGPHLSNDVVHLNKHAKRWSSAPGRLPSPQNYASPAEFIMDQTQKSKRLNYFPPADAQDYGLYTVVSEMHMLFQSNLQLAIDGVFGCLVIVVVSMMAVWMAHIWESPGLYTTVNRQTGEKKENTEKEVRERVLEKLEYGAHASSGLRQFTQPGGLFSAEYEPHVYMFVPSDANVPNRNFFRKVHQDHEPAISNKLQELFKRPVAIREYERTLPKETHSPHRHILFQYSPNIYGADVHSSIQTAGFRLWAGANPRPVDEKDWFPNDLQIVT